MSSNNIQDMIRGLAEGQAAIDALPGLRYEIDALKRDLENALQKVQDREVAILAYKSEIEELNVKLRSLEVERDDAGFRELEALERVAQGEQTRTTACTLVEQALAILRPGVIISDPPKHVEVVEVPQAVPSPAVQADVGSPAPSNPNPVPNEFGYLSSGQSEANPTPSGSEGSGQSSDGTQAAPTGLGSQPKEWNEDGWGEPKGAEARDSSGPTVPSQAAVASPSPSVVTAEVTQPVATPEVEPFPRWTKEWYSWRDRQMTNLPGPAF